MLAAASERVQYSARGGNDGSSSWGRRPSRFLAEVSSAALDEASVSELADFADSADAPTAEAAFRPRRRGPAPSRRRWRDVASDDVEPPPLEKSRGFTVGDWVLHPKHGKGRIVTLQESDRMTLATIALIEGGKRVFSLEHCDLRKL